MLQEQPLKKAHQLKKEHHYVWANYLRNWAIGDTKNKVWFKKAKGGFAYDSVKMVAKEKHFYQIESPRVHRRPVCLSQATLPDSFKLS